MGTFFHPTRRRLLAMAGAALVFAPAAGAESPAVLRDAPSVERIAGRAFGSDWSVTLPAGRNVQALRPALENLLAGIDRQMSPWRADSEISGVNRGIEGAAVSAGVAHVTGAALHLARDSEGWFDPTVGPLVHHWGFGPIRGEAGGWIGLQVEGDRIVKDRAGLTVDLCGIAKGRALDLMIGLLADAGQKDVMVDLGGELAGHGRHPSGRGWRVAIEDPRVEVTGGAGVLELDGLSVATSGNRAQGYDLGGRRYSHIIDPHRAAPAESRLASVSVLSARAMLADGWATALMAAGEAGPDLARRNRIVALFLFRDGAGLRRVTTGGFDRHML